MLDRTSITRRRLLGLFGTSGVTGLAGCGSQSKASTETEHIATDSTEATQVSRVETKTPSDAPTKTPRSPDFELIDFEYPPAVEVGDPFQVALKIKNAGGASGTISVRIRGSDSETWVNYTNEFSRQLQSGETVTIRSEPIVIPFQSSTEFTIRPFGKQFTVDIQSVSDPFLTKFAHPIPFYSDLNKPSAYHSDGRTYVGFHGSGDRWLDPLIVAFDHATETLTGPIKIADNPLASADDAHGYPAIMVDDIGYIHAIYGGHGPWNGGEQRHSVTTEPGNISEWEHLDNLPSATTYPQWIKLDDGTLFLFQRGPSSEFGHGADWTYMRSTDHGRNFEEPVAFMAGWGQSGEIRTDGPYGSKWGDSWYLNIQRSRHPNRPPISITGTYHACGRFGDNGEDHADTLRVEEDWLSKYNQYYLEMAGDGRFTAVDGTDVTAKLPITKPTVDENLLILDTGSKGPVESGYIDHSREGHPHCSFSFGSIGNGERRSVYSIWSDNEWSIKDGPHGAIRIQDDLIDVLRGQWIMRSTTGGSTWEHSQVTSAPVRNPQRVRNPHPDASFVLAENPEIDWTTAPDERDFEGEGSFGVAIYGDSGFLKTG